MAGGKFAKSLIDMAEKAGVIFNKDAAKDLGFDADSTWYHGNNVSNQMDSIDPSKLGSVTETPAAKEAFFLTNSKQNATKFAENAAANGGSPTVHEMVYRPNKTASVDWNEYSGGVPIRSNNGQRILAGLLQDAKEGGLGGVRIKNSGDSMAYGEDAGDVLAVLNPSLLRYKNAKFDPAKKESTSLLAGSLPIGAGAILAGGLTPDNAQAQIKDDLNSQSYLNLPVTNNVGSIRAPAPASFGLAGLMADYGDKYNDFRKNSLAPGLNEILPFGELPTNVWRNKQYGVDDSLFEKIKGYMGAL